MDVPPIPKSDSADVILKDAPQENSKLLYCQYLQGATDMELILKALLWEPSQRNQGLIELKTLYFKATVEVHKKAVTADTITCRLYDILHLYSAAPRPLNPTPSQSVR